MLSVQQTKTRTYARVKKKATRKAQRPRDPDLDGVLRAINHMTPSEVAKKSGNWVGASTIRNWRKGGVRQPCNYTLTAAMRAAGFRREWIRIKG